MIERMSTFRPVAAGDIPRLQQAYLGFARTREWPRFYMAPLWLAAKGEFIWGEVGGCTCIVKRRSMYGRPVIYLILPPMSPHGDLDAEYAVLQRFYDAGVGARLSDEDVGLYGLEDRVEREKGNEEYIYRAGEFMPLGGKRNRRWRHQWNELTTRCEIREYDTCMMGAAGAAAAIDEKWKKVRGLGVAHNRKMMKLFATHAMQTATWGYTLRGEGGPWAAYGMSQAISPGWVVLLVRQHAFSRGVTDAGRAQHLLDTRHWCGVGGGDMLLNIGASLNVAGLASAKEKMRPVKVMSICKLTPTKQLTMSDYYQCKQARGAGFGFGE